MHSADAYQCLGKVPGPSGIQLLVFSRARMSQSCNPWQADRQTGTVSLPRFPARCPALLAFTSYKHHPLAQSFLLQFLEPFALERRSICCSHRYPDQHKHPHPVTGCSGHHDSVSPPSGPVSDSFPVVEGRDKQGTGNSSRYTALPNSHFADLD